jgi:hypothetical protein
MSADVGFSTSHIAETAFGRKALSMVDIIVRALLTYLRNTTDALTTPGKGLTRMLFAPSLKDAMGSKRAATDDSDMTAIVDVLRRCFKRLEEGLQRFSNLQEIATRPQDLGPEDAIDVLD